MGRADRPTGRAGPRIQRFLNIARGPCPCANPFQSPHKTAYLIVQKRARAHVKMDFDSRRCFVLRDFQMIKCFDGALCLTNG